MFITDYFKKKRRKIKHKNIFDSNGISKLNVTGGVGYRFEKLPVNASRFCSRMTSFCQPIQNATFTYDASTGLSKISYTNKGMKDLQERESQWTSEVVGDILMGCTPPWVVTSLQPLTFTRTLVEDNTHKFQCDCSFMKHYITFDTEFNLDNYCKETFDMVPGGEKYLDCESTCSRCIDTWPYVKCQFHTECDMTQLNDLHKCYECERVTCQDHRVSWGGGDDGTMLCYQCYQRFLNCREGKNLNIAQFWWLGKPDHTGIYAEHIKYFDSDSD